MEAAAGASLPHNIQCILEHIRIAITLEGDCKAVQLSIIFIVRLKFCIDLDSLLPWIEWMEIGMKTNWVSRWNGHFGSGTNSWLNGPKKALTRIVVHPSKKSKAMHWRVKSSTQKNTKELPRTPKCYSAEKNKASTWRDEQTNGIASHKKRQKKVTSKQALAKTKRDMNEHVSECDAASASASSPWSRLVVIIFDSLLQVRLVYFSGSLCVFFINSVDLFPFRLFVAHSAMHLP